MLLVIINSRPLLHYPYKSSGPENQGVVFLQIIIKNNDYALQNRDNDRRMSKREKKKLKNTIRN